MRLSVCAKYLKKLRTDFDEIRRVQIRIRIQGFLADFLMKFVGGVGRGSKNNHLDFGADLDHNPGSG